MEVVLTYRRRELRAHDLEAIRALIRANPQASRRRLSELLCELWDWRQANGQLRAMVCRGLMLALHRAGHIELPPPRPGMRNNVLRERRAPPALIDRSPWVATVGELLPLEFHQVRRTVEEPLFDSLVTELHYLSYKRPVGEHLEYIVWSKGRPVACLAWGSAPRHLGPRDQYIGWSAEARRHNTRLLAYNTRFLVLPWVQVPHLASHVLGRMARVLPQAWQRIYGHPVHYLETFVDPARFRGTCYRAANWVSLGLTTGRGHNARTSAKNQPQKEILGYPLTPGFREILSEYP